MDLIFEKPYLPDDEGLSRHNPSIYPLHSRGDTLYAQTPPNRLGGLSSSKVDLPQPDGPINAVTSLRNSEIYVVKACLHSTS